MEKSNQKYKKRIVSINLGNFGSTGSIAYGIAEMAKRKGYKYYCAYPEHENNRKNKEDDIIISSDFFRRVSEKLSYYTGFNGCFAWFATLKFLRRINFISPDIIHFHNLHNSYINLPMLFKYVKKHDIYVVWTLHDCWSFTGQCPHFTMMKCDKWKNKCGDCPQYQAYPYSRCDRTKVMRKLKKKWFTGVKNMIIVTPSQWLGSLVKQSFLSEYSIKVINNGINLNIFKPTESNFRKKYNLQDKYILLGVSFGWDERKGVDVFIELSRRLGDKYKIVLVGTDDNVDKKLSNNIISVHRTNDPIELAEIYSTADIFVNPTREENYPTVNMEALACGTPVITFETGGSPEIIDKMCGCVVSCDDIDTLEKKIIEITSQELYSLNDCLKRAKHFNENDKYNEYLKVYGGIKNEQNKENYIKK